MCKRMSFPVVTTFLAVSFFFPLTTKASVSSTPAMLLRWQPGGGVIALIVLGCLLFVGFIAAFFVGRSIRAAEIKARDDAMQLAIDALSLTELTPARIPRETPWYSGKYKECDVAARAKRQLRQGSYSGSPSLRGNPHSVPILRLAIPITTPPPTDKVDIISARHRALDVPASATRDQLEAVFFKTERIGIDQVSQEVLTALVEFLKKHEGWLLYQDRKSIKERELSPKALPDCQCVLVHDVHKDELAKDSIEQRVDDMIALAEQIEKCSRY